jgi:DNA-binding response OmpR family regulator
MPREATVISSRLPPTPLVLEAQGIRLDRLGRTVTVNRKHCPLSRTEFAMLEVLLLAKGSVLTNSRLIARVWKGQACSPVNLSVTMSHLRRSLGKARGVIRTVRTEGYTIDEEKVCP